jgi:hypothetical protein
MAAVYLVTYMSAIVAMALVDIIFFVRAPSTIINEPIFLLIWALIMLAIFIPAAISITIAPFALVIDGLGPLQAVAKSIEFFMSHKADVFLVGLAVFSVSFAVGVMGLV